METEYTCNHQNVNKPLVFTTTRWRAGVKAFLSVSTCALLLSLEPCLSQQALQAVCDLSPLDALLLHCLTSKFLNVLNGDRGGGGGGGYSICMETIYNFSPKYYILVHRDFFNLQVQIR